MTLRRILAFALASFALAAAVAPGALADPLGGLPAGATRTTLAGAEVATWVGTAEESRAEVPEDGFQLWLAVSRPTDAQNVTSWTYALNVVPTGFQYAAQMNLTIAPALANASTDAPANATAMPFEAAAIFGTPEEGFRELSYNVTATLVATYDNGTNATLGTATLSHAFTVEAPVPPPAIPRGALIAGALVLLGVLVGGIVVGRQRAQRRRMNEAPRRSQVMRELELEKQLEKAKDPEQVQEIKQEIRQQEQVREKRRELQILEAKRADALKTLDLLRKRHEAGGLTKLQYDNMVAKKQGDLQRIEAEIAQMEAEDAGGAAAS